MNKTYLAIGAVVVILLLMKKQKDDEAAKRQAEADKKANDPLNQAFDIGGRVMGDIGSALGGFFASLTAQSEQGTRAQSPAQQIGGDSSGESVYNTSDSSAFEGSRYFN